MSIKAPSLPPFGCLLEQTQSPLPCSSSSSRTSKVSQCLPIYITLTQTPQKKIAALLPLFPLVLISSWTMREKKLRIPLVESLRATSGAVSPKKQVCREEISCCSVLRFRPPGLRHGEMGGGAKKFPSDRRRSCKKEGGGIFLAESRRRKRRSMAGSFGSGPSSARRPLSFPQLFPSSPSRRFLPCPCQITAGVMDQSVSKGAASTRRREGSMGSFLSGVLSSQQQPKKVSPSPPLPPSTF